MVHSRSSFRFLPDAVTPRLFLDAHDAWLLTTAAQGGLPITSAVVESLVKQFNHRVKGTEKFWIESGAESVLQVRAAYPKLRSSDRK